MGEIQGENDSDLGDCHRYPRERSRLLVLPLRSSRSILRR